MTHDYTRKGGIVHAEIMLPAHAPPEFADRSILWNSVEQIEKARDSQLAREIEAALPRELSGEQQLALVRAYVKDNFVDKGMCADFAIHDKGTGNPHVHIMLTLRPLKENGQWGAKCRKAYDLDENGQRIPDGKGGWKNHREDTTDWNDKGNVEIWRAAWAAYKDNADTIVGNMDSQIFLGGSEPTTLKDLSEMLGKETIDAFNTSDTRGNSPSYGTTFQKMGHELLSRDELAVLDGGKCILQLRGVRPFLSDKYDLTQHPNYKLTSDYDPKNTFDIEKYLNRKEKINPNDEFVVIDADSLPSA